MDDMVLAVLDNVVTEMEKRGATKEVVAFNVDNTLVNEIYETTGIQYSLDELKKAVDKCLAHEWLKRTILGSNYQRIQITDKGVGVVQSKRKQKADKANRTALKKVNDYIENHKGLFTLITVLVAVCGLMLAFWRTKNGY